MNTKTDKVHILMHIIIMKQLCTVGRIGLKRIDIFDFYNPLRRRRDLLFYPYVSFCQSISPFVCPSVRLSVCIHQNFLSHFFQQLFIADAWILTVLTGRQFPELIDEFVYFKPKFSNKYASKMSQQLLSSDIWSQISGLGFIKILIFYFINLSAK